MASTPRRVLPPVLSCAIVLALAAAAAAAPIPGVERSRRADAYIASQQRANGSIPAFSPVGSTADAVLAFVAADAGQARMRRALGYLERQVDAGAVSTLGLRAKVVIAWTATGRSARTIGGHNLLRPIRTALQTPSNVFDTALGVLATEAAGVTPPAPALQFLVDNECPDGGWPYDAYDSATEDAHCTNIANPSGDFFSSDTNTTAYVVMGIEASPVPVSLTAPNTPIDFFDAIRDTTNGGWGYTWGFDTTDANSTGLVLQAYAASKLSPPAGSRRALIRLQYPRCGAFAFTYVSAGVRGDPDVGATIGAVPGLLGVALPMSGHASKVLPAVPACP